MMQFMVVYDSPNQNGIPQKLDNFCLILKKKVILDMVMK